MFGEISDDARKDADREPVSTDADRPTPPSVENAIQRQCHCGRQLGVRFCSIGCQRLYWAERKRVRIPAACEGCGKDFRPLAEAVRKGLGKFCSPRCCGEHAARTGKFAGANNPSWRGGVSTDNMRYRKRQVEREPVQEAARRAVRAEIRAGRLIRQPCERCGAVKAQAHHDDYSQPLSVRWLCRKHHIEVHREFKAAGIDPMNRSAPLRASPLSAFRALRAVQRNSPNDPARPLARRATKGT